MILGLDFTGSVMPGKLSIIRADSPEGQLFLAARAEVHDHAVLMDGPHPEEDRVDVCAGPIGELTVAVDYRGGHGVGFLEDPADLALLIEAVTETNARMVIVAPERRPSDEMLLELMKLAERRELAVVVVLGATPPRGDYADLEQALRDVSTEGWDEMAEAMFRLLRDEPDPEIRGGDE